MPLRTAFRRCLAHHHSRQGRSTALAGVLLMLALAGGQAGVWTVSAAQALHLPYPGGTAVQIIEGYNGGTHNGVERYSLDLVHADGATSGSPVLAAASGTVAFAEPTGEQHGCIGVAMDNSGDLHYMYCHVILNHVYSYGDRIESGEVLGTVGAPGLVGNNGTAHVHMQLYVLPGGVRTPVPFAPPDGIPLDGVSLPPDGSFNQWACAGSSCHPFISGNAGGSGPSMAAPAAPLAPQSTPAVTVAVGQMARVQGTGDCLRAHNVPVLASPVTGCAPDGTLVTVANGPLSGEGHTWWYLFNLGWAVSDYLQGTGANASSSAPIGPSISNATLAPPPSPPAAATNGANVIALAPAPATTAVIAAGTQVEVTGTGDCLKVRDSPSMSGNVVNCLSDGTFATVLGGPQSADGHTWWLLDAGGWAAADYLQPASP